MTNESPATMVRRRKQFAELIDRIVAAVLARVARRGARELPVLLASRAEM